MVCDHTPAPGHAHGGIGEQIAEGREDVAAHLDAGVDEDHVAPPRLAEADVAGGRRAEEVVSVEEPQPAVASRHLIDKDVAGLIEAIVDDDYLGRRLIQPCLDGLDAALQLAATLPRYDADRELD